MASSTAPSKMSRAEREKQILMLRRAGLTYRDIAEKLGICPATAYQYVKRALAKLKAKSEETAHEILSIELDRLDRMLSGHWTKAVGGNKDSALVILRIMQRRAAMLGLDAPTKRELSGPGGVPLEPGRVVFHMPDNGRGDVATGTLAEALEERGEPGGGNGKPHGNGSG